MENVDFSNNSQKINSPRSIKACLNLGIKPHELYKLNIIQFKEKYQDVMKLNEFLINFRYEQEDKFRLAMIKLAAEERNKIIEKEEEKKVKIDNEQKKMLVQNSLEKKWKKILENEKKNFEIAKRKQQMEIQSIIEDEIKKEIKEKLDVAREKYRENQILAVRKEIDRKKIELYNDIRNKEIARLKILEEKNRIKEEKIEKRKKKDEERHHAGFLHILIHLRTCCIVYRHVVQERSRTGNGNLERCRLPRLISPVLMVRNNVHLNAVATYLGYSRNSHKDDY